MKYQQWLRSQLKSLELTDTQPDCDLSELDGLRRIVSEASSRGAAAGLPAAVQACSIRQGPISTSIARRVLAACLAACERPDTSGDTALTVKAAAQMLGVSVDKVYDLAKDGRLAHKRIGRTIRFRPADLEAFLQESTQVASPLKLRYL